MEKVLNIGKYVEHLVTWMTVHMAGFFDFIKHTGNASIGGVEWFLLAIPVYLFILLIAIIAWFNVGKGFSIFAVLGLLLIYFMGFWEATMETLALIAVSTCIALIIAIPLGILMAKSASVNKIMRPILDLMQTMPAFVYLIPAVLFFSIGKVPGAFATIIFAMPPAVRFTALGIQQVPKELEESARAFGCTPWQMLYKVELPTAKNTIFAGINQTIMMALSMVVVAGMIAAGGLGEKVLEGINNLDIGLGFESGLAVVILAIILDRITQALGKKTKKKTKLEKKLSKILLSSVFLITVIVVCVGAYTKEEEISTTKGQVNVAYVDGWAEGVAMTKLVDYLLTEQGYDVKVDKAAVDLVFASLANGDTDFFLDTWLPNTHKEKVDAFKGKLLDVGVVYEGAQIGLAVPTYLNINSLSDLKGKADMFNGTIYGIEKGAGITAATEQVIIDYKLDGIHQANSSTVAMLAELSKAYQSEKPIVVALWKPHWAFDRWDLKFLKDDLNTFGDAEKLHVFARLGLDKDQPELTQFLNKLYFDDATMASLLAAFQVEGDETVSDHDIIVKWISEHQELVNSWHLENL